MAFPVAIRWNKRFVFLFLGLCVPMMFILAAVLGLVYRAEVDAALSITKAKEQQSVYLASRTISAVLGVIRGDVAFLVELSSLHQWLESRDASDWSNLTNDFMAFVQHRELYDHVRFLNVDKEEVVRINWNEKKPVVTPTNQLQSKFHSDYAQELHMKKGELSVSTFDLNIEHGVIEQPKKPVIRFSAPVFDSKDRKCGYVILNYKGQRLLDRLRAIAQKNDGGLMLLNQKGYWLLSDRAEEEWGFMYPEGQSFQFEHRYGANVWSSILHGPQNAQEIFEEGLFTYARINPIEYLQEPKTKHWILVAHLPSTKISLISAERKQKFAIMFFTFALLLALMSAMIAYHVLHRHQLQARFRELVNNLPLGVFRSTNDLGGKFLDVNPAMLDIFEADSTEQLLSSGVDNLFVLTEDRKRLNEKIIRQGQISGEELQLKTLQGKVFYGAVTAALKKNTTGEIYLDGVIEDISVRKKNEHKIKELNGDLQSYSRELEAINQELEAFSYSVSHDLRAPLRAIDGFSRTLLNEYASSLDVRGRDRLGRVRTAAQHMATLIDDLLKLARVTRTELDWDAIDLSQLADEITVTLRQEEPNRAARFMVQPDLVVQGDARLLRVVLDNLLGNAWKFTKQRAETVIEIGVYDNAGESIYFVRDNGAGFDMAFADKLFGAFQRLHDTREFSGTGIGLATVQRVVHKHGGRIWAESMIDCGATFYFTLGAPKNNE